MPPLTPSRILATRRLALSWLDAVAVGDLALCDLFERNRQIVLGGSLDHRGRKLLEHSLTERVVVVVDLPRTLGGDDHGRVMRVRVIEQLVDARMDQSG